MPKDASPGRGKGPYLPVASLNAPNPGFSDPLCHLPAKPSQLCSDFWVVQAPGPWRQTLGLDRSCGERKRSSLEWGWLSSGCFSLPGGPGSPLRPRPSGL